MQGEQCWSRMWGFWLSLKFPALLVSAWGRPASLTEMHTCSVAKEWASWLLLYLFTFVSCCKALMHFSPKDSKSMQDGWGESDGPVAGTRHPSWEEEEDGGVWNTAGSQGSASSHNSASWGQAGKKQMKVTRQGDSPGRRGKHLAGVIKEESISLQTNHCLPFISHLPFP